MVKDSNQSKLKIENELLALKAPGPATYEQDDRVLHPKIRD